MLLCDYRYCFSFVLYLRFHDVMTISDAVLGLQRFQGLGESLKTILPGDFFSCELSDFCFQKNAQTDTASAHLL